ncbi:MAG: hypothetical protein MUC67_03515 [Acidobacteria bacterium]|jgi:hypothetical protein|nr:hypothetical protein [Acidobacteriota bacterium]MCU0854769.1 hypothetical protein [Paracoccaceae bacterium]
MPRTACQLPPDRSRRFDRACHALAQLCLGRERRLGNWIAAQDVTTDPLVIERARWLLIVMGHARGTEGGRAIASLARRGYAVSSQYGRWRLPGAVQPLDTPGLLYLGHVLPSRYAQWKSLESVACATDIASLPEFRWCTAHETLRICESLMAEGHDPG